MQGIYLMAVSSLGLVGKRTVNSEEPKCRCGRTRIDVLEVVHKTFTVKTHREVSVRCDGACTYSRTYS